MTNHDHTTNSDDSGAIPPLPPSRAAATPPTMAIGAAIVLTGLAAIAWVFAIAADLDHSPYADAADTVFHGLGFAAVLASVVAGTLWRDYRNASRMAGLHQAVTNATRQWLADWRRDTDVNMQKIFETLEALIHKYLPLNYANGAAATFQALAPYLPSAEKQVSGKATNGTQFRGGAPMVPPSQK